LTKWLLFQIVGSPIELLLPGTCGALLIMRLFSI